MASRKKVGIWILVVAVVAGIVYGGTTHAQALMGKIKEKLKF